ncbi:MAG: transcription termination/antitermination protein NusG [Opitutales bacterium]
MTLDTTDNRRWYTLQVRSNMEKKVQTSLINQLELNDMAEYISKEDILVPEEQVAVYKDGKKLAPKARKLFPGYVFVRVKLFDDDDALIQAPWNFLRSINGVINFMGGLRPTPLRKKEVQDIFNQLESSKEQVKSDIKYSVGESVRIEEGPFMSLTGIIEEIDADNGKLKVSVSIFGRFTPVELDYKQVRYVEE